MARQLASMSGLPAPITVSFSIQRLGWIGPGRASRLPAVIQVARLQLAAWARRSGSSALRMGTADRSNRLRLMAR